MSHDCRDDSRLLCKNLPQATEAGFIVPIPIISNHHRKMKSWESFPLGRVDPPAMKEASVKSGARRSRDCPTIHSASSETSDRHERERGCSILTPLIESTPAACAHLTFDASGRSDPKRAK
jgi:hypothetical protein